jgi:protein-tyrosine-phosphatase
MPRCISKLVARSATTRKIGKHNPQPRKNISSNGIRDMVKKLTPEEKTRRRLESYNPIMIARQALRRAFSHSPIVVEMMRENKRKVPRFNKDGSRHKVDAVEHLCSVCHQWKRSVKGSKVAIDHIDPVIEPNIGFVDLNTYFKRLWCDRSNLQKICGDCHRKKTNAETFYRKFKEEQELLLRLESCHDRTEIKKALKRFTKKKLLTLPYPDEFKRRIIALQDK